MTTANCAATQPPNEHPTTTTGCGRCSSTYSAYTPARSPDVSDVWRTRRPAPPRMMRRVHLEVTGQLIENRLRPAQTVLSMEEQQRRTVACLDQLERYISHISARRREHTRLISLLRQNQFPQRIAGEYTHLVEQRINSSSSSSRNRLARCVCLASVPFSLSAPPVPRAE